MDSLKPDKRNARKHNPRNVGMISDSIQRDGFGRSILLAADGTILAGNATYDAASAAGFDNVIVVESDGHSVIAVKRTDVEPGSPEALRLALSDNRSAELAEWDTGVLAMLGEGIDLGPFFNDAELRKLLGDDGGTQGQTDADDVPDAPAEPKTRKGDLYALGDHRLLCGDSTNAADVERLMGGKKAEMVFTDPPWNVAYGENLPANNAPGNLVRTIMNDKMSRSAWTDFLQAVALRISEATLPGAILYCVMGPSEWPEVDAALRGGGFHWSSTIIWVKDQLVLSRKDYHTQYEPIWYGWNEAGPRLVGLEDRKQSDVWECDRPKASPLHPTTKPVALVERAIKNSSNVGDTVLDVFGGSGSTLIACEQSNRVSYNMELDPIYCDVIITRWEAFTGKTATLTNG